MKARYIIAGLAGALMIGHAPAIILEAQAEPATYTVTWSTTGTITIQADDELHAKHLVDAMTPEQLNAAGRIQQTRVLSVTAQVSEKAMATKPKDDDDKTTSDTGETADVQAPPADGDDLPIPGDVQK